MKLSSFCNKLSINIYISRMFQDDILMFSNDVSLKKVMSTDKIVKLETKLYNADKVHGASIYLEM